MELLGLKFHDSSRDYRVGKLSMLASLIPPMREGARRVMRRSYVVRERRQRYVSHVSFLWECAREGVELTRSVIKDLKRMLGEFRSSLIDLDVEVSRCFTENVVFLSVHPGVGGQESAIFAEELKDKYCAVLQAINLPFEREEGGRLILPRESADFLTWERGVHRVQRVPITESKGRVHTSVVTVNMTSMFQSPEVDLDERDLRMETMRSSGPGGQHVNTTSSAVRLIHIPTGTAVRIGTSRSQTDNRAEALRVLRERLAAVVSEIFEDLARVDRGKVCSNRNDKIRTYNFQTNRMTDHRCGLKASIINWEEPHRMCRFISEVRENLSNRSAQ